MLKKKENQMIGYGFLFLEIWQKSKLYKKVKDKNFKKWVGGSLKLYTYSAEDQGGSCTEDLTGPVK